MQFKDLDNTARPTINAMQPNLNFFTVIPPLQVTSCCLVSLVVVHSSTW